MRYGFSSSGQPLGVKNQPQISRLATPSVSVSFGKNLFQNGRIIPVFGQPGGQVFPDAQGLITVDNPIASLDISSLYPGHEAIAAAVTLNNVTGPITGFFRYTRLSDGAQF